MPLVFSYGTLQQEDVQLSTFGRLLHGQRDELLGYEQSLVKIENPRVVATSGRTHHANVTFNGRPAVVTVNSSIPLSPAALQYPGSRVMMLPWALSVASLNKPD